MKNKILRTENLKKTYKVGTNFIYALDDVTINIDEGEFVAIIGRSGSGKSTLMHMIGLLDTPTSGKVILNGKESSLMSEKEMAHTRNKEVGFVFQSFNLLQRATALENVMLPLSYSSIPKAFWKQKGLEMLDLVGLSDRANNMSNELSGGQKQRVAVARALINDPSIILADEPTGNLDSKTGTEVIDLFKALNSKGKTIILVTHDNDLANLAQRKIVISDGKVISK